MAASRAAAARSNRALEPRLISTHSANLLGVSKSKGHVKLSRFVGKTLCTTLLGQLP